MCLPLRTLKFDYAFESFFPKEDPDLSYYEELIESFGQENDFLFLAISEQDFSKNNTWKTLYELEQNIEKIAEIETVQSIFDETIIQITPFGINQIAEVKANGAMTIDSIETKPNLKKYIGKDQKSMLLTLQHKTFTTKEMADDFYLFLDKWIENQKIGPFQLSGKIQMQSDFTTLLEKELVKLLVIGLSLALVTLFWLFRSVKGVLYPVLIMSSSVIWTMGIMAMTDKPIDVMIVMLPVILVILSISDVVHLINKYDSLVRDGVDRREAVSQSVQTVGKATFTTSFTTAIGFLGLLFLPIEPIKEFGLFAAIGVMIAYGLTLLVIPHLLYLFPAPIGQKKSRNKNIYGLLQTNKKAFRFTLVLSLVISIGVFFVKRNTGLIVGLQKKEALLQKVAYFDDQFNGYRPLEITVATKNLFKPAILNELRQIEEKITQVYQVENLVSPLTLIRKLNAGLYGGAFSRRQLPLAKDLSRIKRLYFSPKLSDRRAVLDNERGTLRYLGTTKDLGSHAYNELNHLFQSQIDGLALQHCEVRITGASYLVDKTDQIVISALIKGLLLACLTVGLITFIIHKNWRVALIIIFVNMIPILTLFGLMGWLSIDLNISTIIIFTVAFGIAVDDSIHFISSFMQKQREGLSIRAAIDASYQGTGKSIVHTSAILIIGFICLMTSGLSAVYYLGLFICLISIIALVFDLKVLPWLLLTVHQKN